MEKIIEVEGLRKSFDDVEAVRGIDFYVEKGKLFAFLGPNGAGKSTTIDILCTLSKQDGGRVIIDGCELGREDDEIRNRIGVVFQDSVLDKFLTVRENLETRARFYGLRGKALKEAVESAAETAYALDFFDRPYGKLSGGQRRRADIARALVNTPQILFLDEPTTGLDPKTRESVWNTVTELQERKKMTVFLTTHYMEEAASADYIILIDKGKIAARGTPYELRDKYSSDSIRIKPSDEAAIRRLIEKYDFKIRSANGVITADISDTMDAVPFIAEAQPFMKSFEVIHGSMDDVFLNITGVKRFDD